MKSSIQFNDLPLLAKIFNPKSDYLVLLTTPKQVPIYEVLKNQHDKKILVASQIKKILPFIHFSKNKIGTIINLSDVGFSIDQFSNFPNVTIINCCPNNGVEKESSSSNSRTPISFDYINNQDGSIRWIYKRQNRKPIFLNLYNNSSWKGKVFHWFFKLIYALQLKKYVRSGSIQVSGKSIFPEQINATFTKSAYAIFTGTKGINRKAVISFEEEEKPSHFLKMPLTMAANELLTKEAFYLNKLAELSLQKIIIPQGKTVDNNLIISNIKPLQPLANNQLQFKHFIALTELYRSTTRVMPLKNAPMWKGIQKDLAILKRTTPENNLSKHTTTQLRNGLQLLYKELGKNKTVQLSIAHGDLTPWNSYLSKEALHVYDWELAENLPLLYDAFHFIFQTGILIHRHPFIDIKQQIDNLEKQAIVASLLAEYNLSFRELYQWYLLRNTTYYLSRYISQNPLHLQAHWLVAIWLEAVELEVQELGLEMKEMTKTTIFPF